MRIKFTAPSGILFRKGIKVSIFELNDEQLLGMLAAIDLVFKGQELQPIVTIHPVNVKIPQRYYEEIQNRKNINPTKGIYKYQIGIRRNSNDRYNTYNYSEMDFLRGLLAGLYLFLINPHELNHILKNFITYKDL